MFKKGHAWTILRVLGELLAELGIIGDIRQINNEFIDQHCQLLVIDGP
jgi:hypothetical protein